MNENDLRDFDFYNEYAYTYCARHLEEDGWSKQEWGNATELYKKKIKALKIINEKNVDVGTFKNSEDVDDYNSVWLGFGTNPHRDLTKEEYELLKEVLL